MRAHLLFAAALHGTLMLAQEEPPQDPVPVPTVVAVPTEKELDERFQLFQSGQPALEEGVTIQREVVTQVAQGEVPLDQLQQAVQARIDEAGGTFSAPADDRALPDRFNTFIMVDQRELESLSNADPSESGQLQMVPSVSAIIADPGVEGIITPDLMVGGNEVQRSPDQNIPRRKPRRGPRPFDSRFDLRDLDPTNPGEREILLRAEAVALVVERASLTRVGAQVYTLDLSHRLGQVHRLCPSEPFAEQPVTGIGTAFLLEGDVFMTADHVMQGDPNQYAVVFGYEMKTRSGVVTWAVSAFDIYYPTRVAARYATEDLVLFHVDRPTGRPPLRWKASRTLQIGEPVYMIGHPMGLPKKVALNSSIRGTASAEYYHTTLDAFAGNSGSPVFSLRDHSVIGVLVAGSQDYAWNGTCNESSLCRLPYCEGERVMRIDLVTDRLLNIAQRARP